MTVQYFCILFHCSSLLLPAARDLGVPHEAEDAGEVPPAAAAAGVEEAQDELLAEAPRLHAHQLQHEAHGDGGEHQPGQVAAEQRRLLQHVHNELQPRGQHLEDKMM